MRPPRKKLSTSQIVALSFCWAILVVLVLLYAKIDFFSIFSIIASGILVFVPIYKQRRKP
ncbi:hypothetical protein [Porphyromonas circumdentaria]|uniref:Uncharacterized protein n=1 Tax=Porphyromonas circumdentaria TaxID=29524 RepID=A0A1T4LDK2_9PORP|nr:hypothetical protein [Porphyromonas circumdentaria]MBB6275300.1 hypothetical protein [Porphyromonas circumdentaria]MDO4722021.1 hypothetical protein [Porphyromonas circumdentaria]SJZ52743.1 hypothetical protein SAMN02745171_00377 [Porphyromonas circumdentaria]